MVCPESTDGSNNKGTSTPTVPSFLQKGRAKRIYLASGLGFGISFEASSRIESQLVANPESTQPSSWSLRKQCRT